MCFDSLNYTSSANVLSSPEDAYMLFFSMKQPVRISGSSLIYGASCSAHACTFDISNFDFTNLTKQRRAVGSSTEDYRHQQMLKALRDLVN